jgi:hypothetical protein
MTTNTMALAETFSIDDDDDSNMDKNTVVTTSTSTTTINTFVDMLNERLDTKTKTRLINSALGSSNSNNLRSNEGDNIDDESDVKLLPGERCSSMRLRMYVIVPLMEILLLVVVVTSSWNKSAELITTMAVTVAMILLQCGAVS